MNRPRPDDFEDHCEPLSDAETAELEAALGVLALAEPPATLDARVAEALRAAPVATAAEMPTPTTAEAGPMPIEAYRRRSGWLSVLTAAAVLALLAALGLSLYLNRGPAPTGPDLVDQRPGPADESVAAGDPDTAPTPAVTNAGYHFTEQPVQLHWSRDLDAGLLTAENAQPVRAIRRQDVEQRVWVDTERGVTVQYTRPRERLVVVKQPTF